MCVCMCVCVSVSLCVCVCVCVRVVQNIAQWYKLPNLFTVTLGSILVSQPLGFFIVHHACVLNGYKHKISTNKQTSIPCTLDLLFTF